MIISLFNTSGTSAYSQLHYMNNGNLIAALCTSKTMSYNNMIGTDIALHFPNYSTEYFLFLKTWFFKVFRYVFFVLSRYINSLLLDHIAVTITRIYQYHYCTFYLIAGLKFDTSFFLKGNITQISSEVTLYKVCIGLAIIFRSVWLLLRDERKPWNLLNPLDLLIIPVNWAE